MKTLRQIKIRCKDCGETKFFYAETIEELFKAIDDAGWDDCQSLCPLCWKKLDNAGDPD